MSEKDKHKHTASSGDGDFDAELFFEQVKEFWKKYSNPITYIALAVILLGGGWLGYKNLVAIPKEAKANDLIAIPQDYFAQDSLDKALNGDGQNPGFLRIIRSYGGTEAGNLAYYYAGAIYLRKQDFADAIKYLKQFNTKATQIQSTAFRMLGDAYMDSGKKQEGAEYYKKAGELNPKDQYMSSENLFRAGLAYETMGQTAQAIELYKEVRDKYPKTDKGLIVSKYLARLGVYQ